jgi:hypothetical protein
VQAGGALDTNRVTELCDDGDLARIDSEEAEPSESQTEKAETEERVDSASVGRDSLLSEQTFPRIAARPR